MHSIFKKLCTTLSILSLMQLAWWGVNIDEKDYQFGVDSQRLIGQQLKSQNTPKEDLHFLAKEAVEPPIESKEKYNN